MKKRGALEISFGMIFSIILIIVFIAFAFFGIKKLLGAQETATIEQFKHNLQEDINKMWSGPQGNQIYEYVLPKKIEQVCFVDDEYENMRFEPIGKYPGDKIIHIDLENTLDGKDEKCFVNSGKLTIKLKKDFGESLVTLMSA
jgi:hypothetical protein